jgi:hypothetical protein
MLKPNKPGDTGPIPTTKETPSLDAKTLPKTFKELDVTRVGELFILNVNGFSTVLDKDQATYIGTRLVAGITELAQEIGPPVEKWRDEEK